MEAKLFRRFLKPVTRCAVCGQDWTLQRADDFPAYVSIFVTGHLVAPLIIALVRDAQLSVTVLAAIVLPLATALMIGLLQPKGAIIALQWWFGMHGFIKERADPIEEETGGSDRSADFARTRIMPISMGFKSPENDRPKNLPSGDFTTLQ